MSRSGYLSLATLSIALAAFSMFSPTVVSRAYSAPAVPFAAPVITTLTPASVVVGSPEFTLTVGGSGFAADDVVLWNGTPLTTVLNTGGVDPVLDATVPAALLTSAAEIAITVQNAAMEVSNALPFYVVNPAPTINSLNPSSAIRGGVDFTLTIDGAGFVPTSTVTFGGNARAVTFVSESELHVAILAADIAAAGGVQLIVSNPAISDPPQGGGMAATAFSINNPTPTFTSFDPTSANAGGPGFILTINGTNFFPDTMATFNGTSKTPTYVSGTQLTIPIDAADIATAVAANVVVSNPPPFTGGGFFVQTFNVYNPAPAITSLNPNTKLAGAGAFTITINGSGFVPTSFVLFEGNSRTSTYVSANQLTASILADDVLTVGNKTVTVGNPEPALGSNASQTFTVEYPAPTISTFSPASVTAGGPAFTLTVNGTGYVTGVTTGTWQGNSRTTTVLSSTQLTMAILAADIASSAVAVVAVSNPGPFGGGQAQSLYNANSPPPSITSLNPSEVLAGSGTFTLTVNGSGFISNSTVQWNGSDRTTTYVSGAQLTATINASDVATASFSTVAVFNPAPNSGIASLSFNVNNPAPTITTLNPASVIAGSGAVTLSINGTNFVTGSKVFFGGVERTPVYVNSTQLTLALSAADLAFAASPSVTVSNDPPAGGNATTTFDINNPVPTVTAFNPTAATATRPAFTLTITGTNFVDMGPEGGGTSVFWAGSPRTTTYVSSTEVRVAITEADIATAGTYTVTVSNPAPGGGMATQNYTVNNPLPILTSIDVPPNVYAFGPGFTLTVNGVDFVNTSEVRWKGSSRATTFVNSTRLTAQILSTDIISAGDADITVFTPTPGGGTSAPITYTVLNPFPYLITQDPAFKQIGTAGFQLHVIGGNFVPTSVVRWDDSPRTTIFAGPGELVAEITAADIATGPTHQVSVRNPPPGGGIGYGLSFTVANPTPVVTSLSPQTTSAGGPAFTLTVNGAGFVNGAWVEWAGSKRTTTFVDGSTLTAAIPASDIVAFGGVVVTVVNPEPGGGSAATGFVVTQAGPTLTSLAPISIAAGSPAFTLTLNGTNLAGDSQVLWNGAPRGTTFVSFAQVVAQISQEDVATQGTAQVSVVNASLPSQPSNVLNFSITEPPPGVRITMTQDTYGPGETITASEFRFQNPGSQQRAIEIKVWLTIAEQAPIPILNLGSDGSFVLPPAFDTNIGTISLFTVGEGFSSGTYEFSSRTVDPVTGALISEDLNPFIVNNGVSSTEDALAPSQDSTVEVNITLSQSTYTTGDSVTATSLLLRNVGAQSVNVEFKAWEGLPSGSPVSIINLGADGSFPLAASSEQNLGSIVLFSVDAGTTRGNYEFSARLLDPVTGKQLHVDLNPFIVQ